MCLSTLLPLTNKLMLIKLHYYYITPSPQGAYCLLSKENPSVYKPPVWIKLMQQFNHCTSEDEDGLDAKPVRVKQVALLNNGSHSMYLTE